jgi:hypothetical protein
MSNFKLVAAWSLGSLIVFSTALALLAIWEVIHGDAAYKVFMTSFIVTGAAIGLSFVASSFAGTKPETK